MCSSPASVICVRSRYNTSSSVNPSMCCSPASVICVPSRKRCCRSVKFFDMLHFEISNLVSGVRKTNVKDSRLPCQSLQPNRLRRFFSHEFFAVAVFSILEVIHSAPASLIAWTACLLSLGCCILTVTQLMPMLAKSISASSVRRRYCNQRRLRMGVSTMQIVCPNLTALWSPTAEKSLGCQDARIAVLAGTRISPPN